MATTQTVETAHDAVCFIPLDRLKRSERNARKTPHTAADIEALAASIGVKTMLQPPVVEPEYDGEGQPTGFYFVTIGEGRRQAQLLRAKRKEIKKTEPIRCVIDTANDAHEISLDENVTRSNMHPADEFEAFEKLARERSYGPEEIAARFGVSAAVVRQRLKLASVSPRLIQCYRDGDMALDHVMAFTVTEDHERQEAIWESLPPDYRTPREIRAHLLRDRVPARDRRAVFVGGEAYQAAGGVIERDLFADDFGGYFSNPMLLDRLALEKLQSVAASIEADGWKWAVASIDRPSHYRLSRIAPTARDLTPEEEAQDALWSAEEEELRDGPYSEEADARYAVVADARDQLQAERLLFPSEDRAKAGAFVSLTLNGDMRIEYGFVRPEDEAVAQPDQHEETEQADETGADGHQHVSVTPKGRAALSDSLVSELTAHRTLALRDALAGRPDLALIYLTHACVVRFFDVGYREQSCLEVRPNSTALAPYAKGILDTKAGEATSERHEAWATKLALRQGSVIDFLSALSNDDLLSLLAHCVALTVNGMKTRDQAWTGTDPADGLASALSLDMLTYWTPTAESYFGRTNKGRILEAVTEATGPEKAAPLVAAKKDVMAEAAEQLVVGTGWLPEPMRTVPVAA